MNFEDKLEDKLFEFWDNFDLNGKQERVIDNLLLLYTINFSEREIEFQVDEVVCAFSFIMIKYNPNFIKNHPKFAFAWKHLQTFFPEVDIEEAKEMVIQIEEVFTEIEFPMRYIEFEKNDGNFSLIDFGDDEELNDEELISKAFEIFNPDNVLKFNEKLNYHYLLEYKSKDKIDLKIIKEAISKANEIDIEAGESHMELISVYTEENEVRLSIVAMPPRAMKFSLTLKPFTDFKFSFSICGNAEANLYAPNDHYKNMMSQYRDMNFGDCESMEDVQKAMADFAKMTPEERRQNNPNQKDDDEFAAIELFSKSKEQGLSSAKQLLITNPHNIEAKILIAGWEQDLEKRINILEEAIQIEHLPFDYEMVEKRKSWWKDTTTRPFMRALYSLAKTFEFGKYEEDAIHLYNEIITKNPDDNQGVRYDFMDFAMENSRFTEMRYLLKKFPDEIACNFIFTKAYFTFKKHGKSNKSRKAIIDCIERNVFLIDEIIHLDIDDLIDRFEFEEDDFEELYSEVEMEQRLSYFLLSQGSFVKFMEKYIYELLQVL